MKKILLVLMATFGSGFFAMAQDVIVLKNAEEIQAKVKSIGLNEILYLKWNNLEGPTYTMPISEILFIKYANGQKDTFTNQIQSARIKPIGKIATQEDFSQPKLQAYTYLGADFTSWFGGPSLDFSLGARTSKYLYFGGGVGWHNLMETYRYYNWLPYLTFTTDIKAYIPTKSKFSPRFDLSFGSTVDVIDAYAGLYLSFGAGFDYRKFSFGAGYQMPVYADIIIPQGYVRLGMRFGK